jgi:hypothetical protein
MTQATERSKFDPHIGKTVYYPGCDVHIVAGRRYEILLVDLETPILGAFVARRYVDFRKDRRWIMDPVAGDRPMFLWVSEILDQIGREITVGQPWNYDKYWDERSLTVSA